MEIIKLIKQSYEIAKQNGFYSSEEDIENIFMGIKSEISECYEADRCNKFADIKRFNESVFCFEDTYKECFSGTFEDELADVYIRVLNLIGHYLEPCSCGILNKAYTGLNPQIKTNNISEFFIKIDHDILFIIYKDIKEEGLVPAILLSTLLVELEGFADRLKIDLEYFVLKKILFNKSREFLHNKKY